MYMSERGALDRLVFAKAGQQQNFLLQAREKLDTNWAGLAELVNVHPRSVRDWAREKYNISYQAALTISVGTDIRIPQTARIKRWIDHTSNAGRIGGAALIKKYNRVPQNEHHRQKKWREWWNTTGKYLPPQIHNDPLPFNIPPRSEKLAEFVGIMLGDGGITKYQLGITLHRYDDKPYSKFVKKLIQDLFHLTASSHPHKSALADTIYISRTELVEYANKKLGLVIGNKIRQQIDIPQWIKDNQKLTVACIRGLVDTDGCVFTHRYTVSGKEYVYKKLAFTSHSIPLLRSVFAALRSFGMNPRLVEGSDVRLDSKKDIQTYFQVVGSSNPKHLKRYKK